MKSTSFKYSTKVWVTGVLLSPLIYFLLDGMRHIDKLKTLITEFTGFMVFSIVLGLVFSLPSYIALYFATRGLNNCYTSSLAKKSILFVASILLTILPFYLMAMLNFGVDISANYKLILYYLITIVASVFYYDVKPANSN